MCIIKFSKKVIDDFVSTVNKRSKSEDKDLYGEVVENVDGQIKVKIDGTDNITPVETVNMDAVVGDRVKIQIKDHKVTLVGNVTSPASARTATSFMKLYEEGLAIYRYSESESVNTYLLLSGETYTIMKATNGTVDPSNDTPLAMFAEDGVFGNDSFIMGANQDSEGTSIIDLSPHEMSLVATNGHNRATFLINATAENPTYNGVNLLKKTDVFPIINTSNSISVSKNIAANSFEDMTTAQISVPNGYSLFGIRAIANNHKKYCHITSWGVDLGNSRCWASVHNTGSSSQTCTLTFYYLLVRNGN